MFTSLVASLILTAAPDCNALFSRTHPGLSAAHVSCAVWPARPEFTLLLASMADANAGPVVLLLRSDDLTVVARLEGEPDARFSAPDLDVAAYRGPDGSPAFGVRRDEKLLSRWAQSTVTTLALYTFTGARLTRVLAPLEVQNIARAQDADLGCVNEEKTTSTVSNDKRHRLVVRSVTAGVREVQRGTSCVKKKYRSQPKVQTLSARDGVFVLP